MREFTTAAAEQHEESVSPPVTVKIDGRETCFTGASSGQIAMMVSMMAADEVEMISTFINFFFALMEKESDKIHYKKRLFSTVDPFGPAEVAEVIQGLVEEWVARPTESPSESSQPVARTGPKSTAKRHSTART